MNDLHIRRAALPDIDTVLGFWREAAEGTSISDDHDGMSRLISRDPEALILAEHDGHLIGTVIAGFDGWRCSAYRLAVHPDHRRQGVATALMEAAEQRFDALGGRRVDAMVLETNEPAHRTWATAGYHRENHWRRWVKPLDGAVPAGGAGGRTTPDHTTPDHA
ncbi:GNAT family N-acetyltransferase [Streptomyces sp. JV176]|uniref:GNAT family N-acetyltransferase n=1 Tax=Streptomyces sp. JV176 TaxID=858630 RepID=UPI002E7AA04D|nr:GNAT family N-acetyltransferase [Streptomyces sp. JV176]MEE1798881.1 GNAT family N-acetyltransferase [Streptomyces sp. JV176]